MTIRKLFDWDRANLEHLARHGVTANECKEAYRNGPLVVEHQRRRHERRRLCLGRTSAGRLLAFVVTERRSRIRFITAYPMPAKLRQVYREAED